MRLSDTAGRFFICFSFCFRFANAPSEHEQNCYDSIVKPEKVVRFNSAGRIKLFLQWALMPDEGNRKAVAGRSATTQVWIATRNPIAGLATHMQDRN